MLFYQDYVAFLSKLCFFTPTLKKSKTRGSTREGEGQRFRGYISTFEFKSRGNFGCNLELVPINSYWTASNNWYMFKHFNNHIFITKFFYLVLFFLFKIHFHRFCLAVSQNNFINYWFNFYQNQLMITNQNEAKLSINLLIKS